MSAAYQEAVTPAVLERCLEELDADALDHLGYLMRERAARLRSVPPKPRASEPVHVPALSIWAWIAEDILDEYPPCTVVEVVRDLAMSVDHLAAADVEAMLVDVLAQRRASA